MGGGGGGGEPLRVGSSEVQSVRDLLLAPSRPALRLRSSAELLQLDSSQSQLMSPGELSPRELGARMSSGGLLEGGGVKMSSRDLGARMSSGDLGTRMSSGEHVQGGGAGQARGSTR